MISKIVQIIQAPENLVYSTGDYTTYCNRIVALALVNTWPEAYRTWDDAPPEERYQKVMGLDVNTLLERQACDTVTRDDFEGYALL